MTAALSSLQVEKMLAAGSLAAIALNAAVCIAVVNSGGNLFGFLRVGEAFLPSTELAIDKAWTAFGVKMSSREFGDTVRTMPDSIRDGLLRRPRLTEVPGGFPLALGGQLVGGVGVSGGSGEEDEAIARAAMAALEG